MRYGAVTLVLMLLVMAAAFNLSKFPGFRGETYQAWFTDASGIRKGSSVQVGGIRSGRVSDVELQDSKVLVTFSVDQGIDMGEKTTAAVEVLNLLGEKYLRVTPSGEGDLSQDDPIPLERTRSAYDIIGVFGDLTKTTEDIDKDALKDAFDVLSETVDSAAPEIAASFRGLSRLSQSVSSRDAELQQLFASSNNVSRVLADRSDELVDLMGSADLVFKELQKRKAAIHRLLVNARLLARELRGVATDNQAQIGPALSEVDDLLDTLISREKELKATLNALGPYTQILSNIIGTGPWFDAYAVNLLAIPTGEFIPGVPEVLK
ncbi:MCE family protein [Nocardioides sp.]|uniref:MCE family protein n=1 Tax=Nocardioides sp. TaxID=35761 RepID=UPI00271BA3C5|nr:MCE family protein [Nocardioides sp.]MDO9456679.1 MCE family protein [Nocardioides sp.]